MSFKPKSTSDPELKNRSKTLLYAHHGFGKTTQCKYYQERYGSGFIISGEGGLKSLEDCNIDYLEFSSWDGEHDPAKDIYSFKGICKMMAGKDFKDRGYKWIAIDSLTELSDRLLEELSSVYSKSQTFDKWDDYASQMLGALKWIRDLDYHVLMTALAKEEMNGNGQNEYWPMMKGKSVMKQVPGLFDNVLCGVRHNHNLDGEQFPKVERFIVTDEVRGWHGKVRDPHKRIRPVERTGDVTEILIKISLSEEAYKDLYAPKTEEEKPEQAAVA